MFALEHQIEHGEAVIISQPYVAAEDRDQEHDNVQLALYHRPVECCPVFVVRHANISVTELC